MADVINEEAPLRTVAPDFPEGATATLPISPAMAQPARDRQERSRPTGCKPLMNRDMMLNATSQSKGPTCPKCRCPASLRLRARLREADGFPEVQCFECWACGEVLVVERGLGEDPSLPRTEVGIPTQPINLARINRGRPIVAVHQPKWTVIAAVLAATAVAAGFVAGTVALDEQRPHHFENPAAWP